MSKKNFYIFYLFFEICTCWKCSLTNSKTIVTLIPFPLCSDPHGVPRYFYLLLLFLLLLFLLWEVQNRRWGFCLYWPWGSWGRDQRTRWRWGTLVYFCFVCLFFALFLFLGNPLLNCVVSIFFIKYKSELNCNRKHFFFSPVGAVSPNFEHLKFFISLYVTDTFPSVTSHENRSHRMTGKLSVFHYRLGCSFPLIKLSLLVLLYTCDRDEHVTVKIDSMCTVLVAQPFPAQMQRRSSVKLLQMCLFRMIQEKYFTCIFLFIWQETEIKYLWKIENSTAEYYI